MSGTSIQYDIQQAAVTLIQAQCGVNEKLLNLSPANVKGRMMPKVGEIVDPLPCIIVAPTTYVGWEPLGFEGIIDKQYGFEVAIVAASNQDYEANQEEYQGWLEQIGRIVIGDIDTMYTLTSPAVPSVWDVVIDHEATFDRSKLNQNYAYQSIFVLFKSEEEYN